MPILVWLGAAKVVGWLIWAGILYIAVTWTIGVFVYIRRGVGVSYGSIFQTTFAWILALLFLVTEWNKLHLLWLVPLAWAGSLLLQGMVASRR